jgi:ribosomal protein S27E
LGASAFRATPLKLIYLIRLLLYTHVGFVKTLSVGREVRVMSGRCPGQDGRDLKVSMHICPYCGSEVEMFSDETRVKCHTCGNYVCKDEVPSCVAWCSKARECVGEERWAELKGGLDPEHQEAAGIDARTADGGNGGGDV